MSFNVLTFNDSARIRSGLKDHLGIHHIFGHYLSYAKVEQQAVKRQNGCYDLLAVGAILLFKSPQVQMLQSGRAIPYKRTWRRLFGHQQPLRLRVKLFIRSAKYIDVHRLYIQAAHKKTAKLLEQIVVELASGRVNANKVQKRLEHLVGIFNLYFTVSGGGDSL